MWLIGILGVLMYIFFRVAKFATGSRKKAIIMLAAAVGTIGILYPLIYGYFGRTPPRQQQLAANFRAHRSTYEQLRTMVQQDKELVELSDNSVETSTTGFPVAPNKSDLPMVRYQEYLSLLKEIDGKSLFTPIRGQSSVCILLWRWGFAETGIHICACWLDQEPSPEVADLDTAATEKEYNRPRRFVYWKIDDRWYLRKDW
jgi:hypothetical protein